MQVLAQICDFVTAYAQEAQLDDKGVYAVQLAVDEAATNVIEHAYGGDDRGELHITCKVDDKCLTVIIHDHGRAFDPNRVPEPITDVPLEQLRSRGLGVFLIRRMMDEVCYEFSPAKGNTLTMVKHRGPEEIR